MGDIMRMRAGWMVAMAVELLTTMMPMRASAFDLTGQWIGKMTCKGILAGEKASLTSKPSTLLIDQSAGLQLSVDGVFYKGEEFPDPSHPTRGQVSVIRCGTNTEGADFGGALGRLKVITNPEKRTGSLGGTSFRTDVLLASSVYTCRWAYKRVSTEPPSLEGCP
jgi:hypothetical protein